ncbi:hypothetical protein GF354_00570 [Candidatus Peregrinibacteria bacterium]|nr:hypothetical protein [Candidatus Peregrinibacteria bacterium]
MKITLWVLPLISILLVAGCQTPGTFNASDFTPPNAQDISVQDADFNGDGISEKVLYYKSDDTVDSQSKTTNQHLLVISNENSQWQTVKEDAFANSNKAVLRFLRDHQVVDINNDGNQELLVQWSYERPMPSIGSYNIVTVINGEYKILDAPKLNNLEYLDIESGEAEMHLRSILATRNGIEENYTIYCQEDMEGKPMSNLYEKSCRELKITVTLDNGTLIRQ